MKKLIRYIDELEKMIPIHQQQVSEISSVDIGWHIAHSLKVITSIYKGLQNSNPNEYQRQFNWKRLFVHTFKYIPVGQGKAPNSVVPTEVVTEEALHLELKRVREMSTNWDVFDKKKYIKHPVFGNLNVSQTITFMEIHTHHHLKIMKRIQGVSGA